MGIPVMMNCPTTGKAIETPIGTTVQAFETLTFVDVNVKCPHCRQLHPLTKESAYLADVTPSSG